MVPSLCEVQVLSAMRCAKTVKPIKMPFGLWAWVGPRRHVLDGGAYCRHLVNTIGPYMRQQCGVFVKLRWPVVRIDGVVCRSESEWSVFVVEGDVSESVSVSRHRRRQQHKTSRSLESWRRPAAMSCHVRHWNVAGKYTVLFHSLVYLT